MKTTLSERLQDAMRGPPLVSSADLARACKVAPPSVNGWLSGKSKTMEAGNLLIAAKICKVNANWLCFGIGPKEAEVNWPLQLVDRDRYEALSDVAKGAVQTRMMDEIEAQERKAVRGNGTTGP